MSQSERDGDQQYYQLTHDYLVRSLRDWLTRKQRETQTGRTELKLAERFAAWNATHENKQLATLWEWLQIRTLTSAMQRTIPQQTMLQRANQFHLVRSGLSTVALIAVVRIGLFIRGQTLRRQQTTRIEGRVGGLVSAEPTQLSQIVKELDTNSDSAATFLAPLVSTEPKTNDEKRSQLHAGVQCQTGGFRIWCRLVRLGLLLPVTVTAVWPNRDRSVVCGSGIDGRE